MNAAQEAIDIVACAAEEARDRAEQLGDRAAALYLMASSLRAVSA